MMTRGRSQTHPGNHHFTWTFSKIFRRKHFFAVNEKDAVGVGAFQTINKRKETSLTSYGLIESDQAQVWSVRNRNSKSLVDDIGDADATVRVKEAEQKSGSQLLDDDFTYNTTVGNHKFDVLGNWKHYFVSGFVEGDNRRGNVELITPVCISPEDSHCAFKDNNISESFVYFGSSESLNQSPWSSRRASSSTKDSTESVDDLDTSYWDLRIPDPEYNLVNGLCNDPWNPNCRRFSEGAAVESPFGSPSLRKELAHRRLSENIAAYEFNRNMKLSEDAGNSGGGREMWERYNSGVHSLTGRRGSEGSSYLLNHNSCMQNTDRSRSLRERRCTSGTIFEGEVSPSFSTLARLRGVTNPCEANVSTSQSNTENRHFRNTFAKGIPSEKHRLHRSRSADTHSRLPCHGRKRSSFSVSSPFAFPDMDSSDESEYQNAKNQQRTKSVLKKLQDIDCSASNSSSISEESDRPSTSSDTKESKSISSSTGDDSSVSLMSDGNLGEQQNNDSETNMCDLKQDESDRCDNSEKKLHNPSISQGHHKADKQRDETSDSKDSDGNRCTISTSGLVKDSGLQRAEFKSLSVDDLLFCSGKHGALPEGGNDVDMVFDAIATETKKPEYENKDMVVMFLVGGEVKVLRRKSGKLGHVESIRSDVPSMTRKDTTSHNGTHDHGYGPTIHEVNRGRPKSAIIVTRSHSFAGMANPQPPPVSIGASSRLRDPPPGGVVLGESFRHHRSGAALPQHSSSKVSGHGYKKSPKVPKVPRPNRAVLMFQSVKRGIKEFIAATKEDIEELQRRGTDGTSTAQGRVHETDKQIKSAERYLKRLEFHHAKLDELHEYYMLQQQLREGVRTMHRAYVTSPGKQRTTLSNVKYGYKECTQTMCGIEAQLEAMLGTFNCKLKGIAGFARLCPGDVFEVTIRHGTQKWKTKGRIEKTGNQKWDIPEFNFKAVIGDIINIKGVEVRAFKSILLGQKSCETKDLFSANPQLMTVSINVNGSLKLSIVITWNPLDGVEESASFVDVPVKSQGTPRRRPVSVIALNGEYGDDGQYFYERRHSNPASTLQQTKDDNFILRTNVPVASSSHPNNINSYHGLDSPHVGSRHSEHLPSAYQQSGPLHAQTQAIGHLHSSSPALPAVGSDNSEYDRTAVSHQPTGNQTSTYTSGYVTGLPMMAGHLHFPSVSLHGHGHHAGGMVEGDNSELNVEDVLHNLSSALEDYHGQYDELQSLEEAVKFARKLLRKQFRRSSSRSSSISVSIESALEAFDFLDTEETTEEPQSPATTNGNNKTTFDDMLCSPESTAKTGDSGIESLAQRLSDDTQLGSSVGSSPVPPSTGNEEVDQCLLYHFIYCERLLENLGAFGPLKCREIYALDKLGKQTSIINSLLKLAKSGSQVDLHSVMTSICEDKSLREFWVKCTGDTSLYIHPDRLLSMLEQKYSSVIIEKYAMDPNKVCQHVLTRVLDIPDYEVERGQPHFLLTLHQFMAHFTEEGGLKHVEDVAQEMKLVEKLTSGNPDVVIKAILMLRDTLPSAPCLKVIGMLLVTMDKEVEQCTISYLNLIQRKGENRDRAMVVYVEGLEDRMAEIRCGACAALAILEASESIDQLVYLWQSDSSSMVQQAAKKALLSLGDDGRKAFEDAQLSKHGFQGFQVHK